jgi:hypothetical protein
VKQSSVANRRLTIDEKRTKLSLAGDYVCGIRITDRLTPSVLCGGWGKP